MKRRGRFSGAVGWLVEPLQPEQLRRIVARVLGAARASLIAEVLVLA